MYRTVTFLSWSQRLFVRLCDASMKVRHKTSDALAALSSRTLEGEGEDV